MIFLFAILCVDNKGEEKSGKQFNAILLANLNANLKADIDFKLALKL